MYDDFNSVRPRHSAIAFCRPAATLLSSLLLACAAAAQTVDRPNILFVLTDDVGIGDIRTYNPDGKVALPTIENLAREGVRFTDAHVSAAKCAPSRYSIITGNYHWRGLKGWGQWSYKGGSQITEGQETLGTMLSRAGYETAFIGKYHLGADFYRNDSDSFVAEGEAESRVDFSRRMANGPAEHGFQTSFVALRGIQDSPYAYFSDGELLGSANDLVRWEVGDYGDTEIVKAGIGLPSWVTRDVGPTLLAKGIDFIERHHQSIVSGQTSAPFFLYFNTQAVHNPRKPPVAIGQHQILGESGLTTRTDMLLEIDVILDNLISALDERDMLEDTLIIFTSDNGGLRISTEARAGHLVSAGFRGDKGTIYEGGHRVPLIVKWGQGRFGASTLPQGAAVDGLVAIQDLYATLAALVGVSLDENEALDSVSILPMLRGLQTLSPRSTMVFEADAVEDNAPDGGISGNHFAYRSGDFKLILDSRKVPVALYDLAVDPAELTNLVNRSMHHDRVTSMRAAFNEQLSSDRTAPLQAPNTDPTIEIVDPLGDPGYSYIDSIVLTAMASDPEDGDLGGAVVWTSSIDGELGSGSSITVTALTIGAHSITAAVSDSGGAMASSEVVLSIENRTPTLSIDNPASGATANHESEITFEGSASDFEDGDLSSSIAWTSSIDGAIGTGSSVSTFSLSVGDHSISAATQDSLGIEVSDTIQVSVTNNVAPPPPPPPPPPAPRPAAGGGGGGELSTRELLLLFGVLLLGRAARSRRRASST